MAQAPREPLITRIEIKQVSGPRRAGVRTPRARTPAEAKTIARPQAFFCENTPCQSPPWPVDASSPTRGKQVAATALPIASKTNVRCNIESRRSTGKRAAKYRPKMAASPKGMERRALRIGSCDQSVERAAKAASAAAHCMVQPRDQSFGRNRTTRQAMIASTSNCEPSPAAVISPVGAAPVISEAWFGATPGIAPATPKKRNTAVQATSSRVICFRRTLQPRNQCAA